MFSALESWGFTVDTRVLDLYAGSGALGLEAASRGAASVELVERHAPTVRVIEANIRAVQKALQGSCVIRAHKQSAKSYLANYSGDSFDVVFVDPPYDFSNADVVADLAALTPHLVDDAVVVVERDTRSGEPEWPAGLELVRTKKYGETTLWWLEPSPTTTDEV